MAINGATYKAEVWCPNCDFNKEIEIEKGVKISDHPCPNCGNLGLKKPAKVIHARPPYRGPGQL